MTATTSPSKPEVRMQLDKVCRSTVFNEANRLCDFLRYIANEATAGRGKQVNASSIAIDVFKKGADFDANSQSLVRVQAGQLRLRLAKYYSDLAKDDEVLIEVPKGRYAPVFSYVRGALVGQTKAAKKASDVFRLSVLVLPPNNLSGNADFDLTCLGFSEEIVTALTKFPELRTLSASSIWEESPSVESLSSEDADYALRGSLRAQGHHLRLVFHLISLKDRTQIWSSEYEADGSIQDMFSVQSSIARAVVFALTCPTEPLISGGPSVIGDDPDQSTQAYHAVLDAYEYHHHPSRERHGIVKEKLLVALKKTPSYPEVRSMLAMIYLNEHRYGYLSGPVSPDPLARALLEAQEAVNLSPRSGLCWHYLAQVYFDLRDFGKYHAAIETSLSLSMRHPYVLVEQGHHLWMMGEEERGRQLIAEAFEANPRPPGWYYFGLVHDSISLGRFDLALEQVSKLNTPDFFWANFLAAVVHGHYHHTEASRTALKTLEHQHADFANQAETIIAQAVFPETFKANAIAGLNKAKQLAT